jgi:peptidoglycan/xylan/chitin deacetylase (PgdA/CDA1 family)
MLSEYEFALCLTHDVDRPYKTYQAPYYAFQKKDPRHLKSVVTSEKPYWQFETIMELEDKLDVRSTFYFLDEKSLFRDKGIKSWIKPKNWRLSMGRYFIKSSAITEIMQKLHQGGWEIGLHGSYESYNNLQRLKKEKEKIEQIIDTDVIGGRQHYLNLAEPETWEYHRKIGLKYDSSLGSSQYCGFEHGYKPNKPFDDQFVVFPLTIMELAIFRGRSFDQAWERSLELLTEAKQNNAIMTILWHPRYFSEEDFPGYKKLYAKIIEEAKQMGGWVGNCASLYKMINESK